MEPGRRRHEGRRTTPAGHPARARIRQFEPWPRNSPQRDARLRHHAVECAVTDHPSTYQSSVHDEHGETMSKNPTYHAAAIPYLMVRGAVEALAFYTKAFGA